uniref:Uncharacterized protein n=1 Tax=Physcomitrium patens TaxID=3218 RepID=A0A2K1L8X5_PHYPA|nr:hypothetical protein PHYPA_000875 [Physcomitrium patens]
MPSSPEAAAAGAAEAACKLCSSTGDVDMHFRLPRQYSSSRCAPSPPSATPTFVCFFTESLVETPALSCSKYVSKIVVSIFLVCTSRI